MSGIPANDRPNAAGIYDYLLGGTVNSAVDRAAADRTVALLPELAESAWANRGFLQRAVAHMAHKWGIRQFLDLGSGLPTQRCTHEVVAELAPDARVVYVDRDPATVERARGLLRGVPGATVLQADIREPDAVLAAPQTRELIDFDQPVGVLLVAVTQFLLDEDDPWGLVRQYLAAVPAGSCVAISAPTGDKQSEELVERVRSSIGRTTNGAVSRSRAEFTRFFDGLEIMPPYAGADPVVVHVGQWGAEDPVLADDAGSRWFYAAVARKPDRER
ncbi:SAM-dependent methyltransferase [Cryptosporangium sp. NPDC051539]|uniref:SAM-dependent methyltransferase n=1 Tax=Cryptosporangium sp. NPDC051539 TaxID=3363962 RepID=UPI0037B24D44